MTRPGSRSQPAPSARIAAGMSGAVDLSALKEKAAPPPNAASGPIRQGGPPQATGLVPVLDVTEATFEEAVLARSYHVVVVVDLWATWCEPCKQLSPVLEKMATDDKGSWALAKIDVDENPRIAQAFGVQSIPAVVAIAAGQPVHAFQGVQSEPQIREWLAEVQQAVAGKLTGPPASADEDLAEPAKTDPRFAVAEDAINAGDLDGAAVAFQKILDTEPDNADAVAAMRQVQFLRRAQAVSPDTVALADADLSDVAAQLAAADFLLLSREVDAAFTRLIATIKRSAGDDKARVRTRLVELFELFDPTEPVVVAARRKLAAALF